MEHGTRIEHGTIPVLYWIHIILEQSWYIYYEIGMILLSKDTRSSKYKPCSVELIT